MPPHGALGRQHWKNEFTPRGPIGLALQSTHNFAATLDLLDGVIRKANHYDVHLFHIPWQQLQPILSQLAGRAIFSAETTTRSVLHGLSHVDSQ
eukprot:5367283-Karenia_brevis.AAC.1